MALTFEKIFHLLIIVVTWASLAMSRPLHEVSISAKHKIWMAQSTRTYKDQAEKEMRFKIFKKNYKFIEKFNREGNRTYKMSLNEFADLTDEEFIASYTGYKMPPHNVSTQSLFSYPDLSSLPQSIDWRERGAVTPVKNQYKCGCCWVFSAVAAVEGISQISTGNLISLSEQQVLDCTKDGGCNGGWMNEAFSYIIRTQGLTSEDIYPYQQTELYCDMNRGATKAAKISCYQDVSTNELALQDAVSRQPVSVALDASGFKYYRSGVFDGPCGNADLNHAVTVVGYGTSNEGPYWLIKNSWGQNWGEGGYIRLRREVGGTGLCGIAMRASYPIA